MSPITKALGCLGIAMVSGLLSIIVVVLVGGLLTGEKTMDFLFYTALQLVMRWLTTLVLGSILFATVTHLLDRKGLYLWTIFLLAVITAFLMVAFREGETVLRYGLFSSEYLNDILRNSMLFIPYFFLVPLLFFVLIKKPTRKRRTAQMNIFHFLTVAIIWSLLACSCTTPSYDDTAQVKVEYLQYVSGVSSHQEDLDGQLVLKRTINANYALELSEVVSEIQLYDQIDSLMCSLYSDSLRNYEQASYAFFRRSAVTNNENLGKNRKQFTDYSEENDILVSYEWHNGVFGARHEHYEGSVFPINTKWYDWDYKCDLLRSE